MDNIINRTNIYRYSPRYGSEITRTKGKTEKESKLTSLLTSSMFHLVKNCSNEITGILDAIKADQSNLVDRLCDETLSA